KEYPFIKDEIRLIESAMKTNTPALGVCLGAQLMAAAAGARVYKGKTKEIGWYGATLTEEGMDDRLFMGLSDEFTVFQWHGDTFDLPRGSVLLASSELFPNQAVRIGSRAYAVQFHIEVTEKMISEWIEVNSEELKGLKGVIDPVKILRETREKIVGLHAYGRTVIERFLRLVD
ncbi:MAG TPA: gamma-glutamyl-gamma-aminobutyrate hydrolase family protein, partial [Thermodesulfobacteriota bacterium]|nr:gamma-glutamyl-gamma-aminobutyrate hydrolase family protein [Thermodesulfobacteriota bacterium]